MESSSRVPLSRWMENEKKWSIRRSELSVWNSAECILFGHIRCMDQATPTHQALHLSVVKPESSRQFGTRKRPWGCSEKYWTEQITMNSEHRAFSRWCLRCWDRSVGMEDPVTHLWSGVKRERERDRHEKDHSLLMLCCGLDNAIWMVTQCLSTCSKSQYARSAAIIFLVVTFVVQYSYFADQNLA